MEILVFSVIIVKEFLYCHFRMQILLYSNITNDIPALLTLAELTCI